MKRALITTESAKPGLVSIYSQVQADYNKDGAKEVIDQLYQIANDRTKTPQEILTAQKNSVIKNFATLSQGSEFELQQAFVIMTQKSGSSITPHDFSFMLYELEKQAPDYLKHAIRNYELTGLEDHLREGIGRYNWKTGEKVTLNRKDFPADLPSEVVGEIFSHLALSDQINLSITRKSHDEIFQNLCYSKIEGGDERVSEHLKTMSPYAIYKNIANLRKFPFLADDTDGMKVLRQQKVGGLKTIQNIKNGTFKTIEDALESRKVELKKLVNQWGQLSDELKAMIMWPVVCMIYGDVIEELEPYINDDSIKPTVELLIEKGMDAPHIKYIGDGSINIDDDPDSYIPLDSEDEMGNLRLYGMDEDFEHTYIDTGLLPIKLYFSLESDQVVFLMNDWIVKYVRKGVLTSIDIEEILDKDLSGLDAEGEELPLLHSWTQKIISKDQISFEELDAIFGFTNYQRELFKLTLVQEIINAGRVPFEQAYNLDENQCKLLSCLLAKPYIVNTVGRDLIPNLFSWKLDVLLKCKGFKQKIEMNAELLREFLALPDFAEQHLHQPSNQEKLENGLLTLNKLKEMTDMGVEEFNEQMGWIDIVGNSDLILFQAER